MSGPRLLQRAVLIYLSLSGLLVGVWATFFPRSFYDDFPGLGRMWISADGPMNEHLLRDVGQLSLALAVVSVVAARTLHPLLVRTAGAAWLLNAVPHLVYHLRHLDKYDTSDQIGNVVSLGLLAVLPIVVLAVSFRRRDVDQAPASNQARASATR